jgi:hypothetical protein
LLFEFGFIVCKIVLSIHKWSALSWGPFIRLGYDKAFVWSIILSKASFLCSVIFWILNILHIRYNWFRIKAMLLISLELLIIKLLTLYSSRIYLFELRQICVFDFVCLSRMMSHLWKLRFLLCHIWSLELFDHLFFPLFVLRKGTYKIFNILSFM